jgi:putative intracellular protease/amidase
MPKALENKKIAVIVDNLFIPEEIAAYQKYFGDELGAKVELITRRWGQAERIYFGDLISDLEPKKPEDQKYLPYATFDEKGVPKTVKLDRESKSILSVTQDFDDVDPNDYDAVLMAANYCSVRLRQSEDGEPRNAPAVKFFAKAMSNPMIVKGALCHGLWLLTPMPELLRGREFICHTVVKADIRNAGAIFRDDPSGVVVDGDLVTGKSKHEAVDPPKDKPPGTRPPYIQAIVDRILDRPGIPPAPSWSSADLKKLSIKGKRRVLIIVSELGYWGEELIGPLEVFDAAGYQVDFATPNGKRPGALPPSMDPMFIDPPLGRSVTSEIVAQKTRDIDGTGNGRKPQSFRLDEPISLAKTLPEIPYWSAPNYLRRMETYYSTREKAWNEFVALYDTMLIVGGSGPTVDLVNNPRVHDLILGFYYQGKPIAAECYGVPCLAFAREIDTRKSLLWGKHVTGHCREYDYKHGHGYLGINFDFGPPPYPLEYILRDATGPDGGFHGNVGHETSVIVDYPFITGRSTPDAYLTGQKVVEVLELGLRQFGWGPSKYA